MDDKLSVGFYARVSSQRQAEELTVQSQVAALERRIQDDQSRVDGSLRFIDEGYSGATLVRPALERLRDIAWAGGIDRLYVHSPDRLARKYAYQVLLLDELNKQDIEVVFLNDDGIGHTSPEGGLLLQMQGMIAEYERAKILERTRRGRRFAAKQGKVSVMGHAPYGYRYVSKQQGDGEARWDVVPEEAKIVKEMFNWVSVEGLSLAGVVRRLGERCVATRTGKPCWDTATIRGMLLNPGYTGAARYGKTRLAPRKSPTRSKRGDPAVPRREKVAKPTPPEEHEVISVPAIVSPEVFEQVRRQLDENRRRQREQTTGAKFLLGGLLICHLCGSAYCGQRMRRRDRKGDRYVYYRCLGTDKHRFDGKAICTNKSLNGALLEESVWSDVRSLLQEPNRMQREFERRLQRPSAETWDESHAIDSIGKLKRRVARLIDAYENGWLDKNDFEPRIRRAKDRLAGEEAALEEHRRHHMNDDELRLLIGHFEMFAERIAGGLNDADLETKRKLMRLLIHRIEVDADEVRIVYKVQPRPFVPGPDKRGRFLQDWLSFRLEPFGLKQTTWSSPVCI